ncbi:hypothetical protein ACVWXU_007982 [Streptomyces sp. TE33382]
MRSATAPDTTTSATTGPRSQRGAPGAPVITQPSPEPGRNPIRSPRPRGPVTSGRADAKAGVDSRSRFSLITSAARSSAIPNAASSANAAS